MKKIISVMLVMIVVCVYAGCGGGVDKMETAIMSVLMKLIKNMKTLKKNIIRN